MKSITSTEANRSFSKLLGRAMKGETVAITHRGRVVARIVPEADQREKARRDAAFGALLERLKKQPAMNLPRISREELYEDD
jgi:prevent-host-death family protein